MSIFMISIKDYKYIKLHFRAFLQEKKKFSSFELFFGPQIHCFTIRNKNSDLYISIYGQD